MLWDLAHSTCAFPVSLNACKADLAVGCTYKYVNAGPGAGLCVSRRSGILMRLMRPRYRRPFRVGSRMSAVCLRPEIRCARRRTLHRRHAADPAIRRPRSRARPLAHSRHELVREASVALTTRFIAEVEQQCAGMGLTLCYPARGHAARFVVVSFRHAEGLRHHVALIARGVIGDFRAPDILRFGFTPLYVTEGDVDRWCPSYPG